MRSTALTTLIPSLVLGGVVGMEPVRAAPADGMVVGITKIVDNGPAANRFNLVLMGDGYQQGDLAQFAQDCQDFVDFMFQTPPFDGNCSINVYRIDVTSTDSGADDPNTCTGGTGATAATYFDSTFCSDGVIRRLLGSNNGTATAVLNAQLPEWNQGLILVNTTIYGGSGGTVGVTSLSGTWENIAIHEFGHSAFGLADEYEYWSGCSSGETDRDNHPASEPSQPNVTIESDRNLIKWASFIDAATAMPTTTNADCTVCDPQGNPFPGMQVVGAYEGAHYYHCDAYRPVFSCMMRNFADFCPVCTARINQTLAPFTPDDTTTPPSITSFAVSAEDVDANCVGSITFFAGVSDLNYLPENGIEVTVSNPTNNATVSNVTYTVTPNGTNAFTISGSATVSNLTGCPATILVTIEATDGCGNTATEQASANVRDLIPPQVSLMLTGGVVDDACEYVMPWSAILRDNCCVTQGGLEITLSVPTDNATLSNLSANDTTISQKEVRRSGTVTVSALTSCPATVKLEARTEDCCGNTTPITSTTADVNDVTPPTPLCPEDLVLGRGTTFVCKMTPNEWLNSFSATDNCDTMPLLTNDSVAQGAPCGGFPCDGTTTVTFTAEDDCGNVDSCTARITVIPDHPGWNKYDAKIELTGNQPVYWGASDGRPIGIPPFDSLDPGCLPGRKDPEGTGDRIMRGYLLAWAVNTNGEEIRWNHLAGDAMLLNYGRAAAVEYPALAFQALGTTPHGSTTGTPGDLHLDGVEYQAGFAELLFNFFATGAVTGSGTGRGFLNETDLTLLPLSVDLRQETVGPVTTKANFTIWNMNEFKFSGTERCVTCWDQTLLGNYDAPNHFLLGNLQTDMGKARVDGLASQRCDRPEGDSQAASLVGMAIRHLSLNPKKTEYTGGLLAGLGSEVAIIRSDLAGGTPSERPVGESFLVRTGNERGSGRPAEESPLAGSAELDRASGSTKGSLLMLAKVELRWTADGDYLLQDTFINMLNDFPADVDVQMYFVNGDPPIEP